MKYSQVIEGTFISRPNRFIAHVNIAGTDTVCHVKNTGRCKELLLPGARVFLAVSDNPSRKTRHDLIAVMKGSRLINMDSQAPNLAAGEWLRKKFPGAHIQSEHTRGDSRFDFHVTTADEEWFIEVKGVTLERENQALFPDAPTQRGAKHLRGLQKCVEEGCRAAALFVVQMQGIASFAPNEETDPAFARALRDAQKSGVEIWCMDCRVQEDGMEIADPVPVIV